MIKVLWLTNIVFPEALQLLTGKGDLRASGGWMLGAASALLQTDDVLLSVATVSSSVDELRILNGEKIRYYILPMGRGNQKKNDDYRMYWKRVNEDFKPDVVHIHGTEYSHGLAYVDECGAENVVVSIQGLTSVCTRYYNQGLSIAEIVKNITFRDILRGTLFYDKKAFRQRGEFEIELLKKVNHIIGRTSWDKAHAWAINPKAEYHYGGEILRAKFYEGRWEYSKCVPHTIFLSSMAYPIKGFHQVLKAMPLILRHYPDTHIRITGGANFYSCKLVDRLKRQGYAKYLGKLIRKFHLEEHILFLGSLDAEGMKQEYLKCNVFVCPSSIENSPNSLGEAQILGVPVIASYVGGVPDMMQGDEEHLYRFEEVEMLAEKICRLFAAEGNQPQVALTRKHAMLRHSADNIVKDILRIYNEVSK